MNNRPDFNTPQNLKYIKEICILLQKIFPGNSLEDIESSFLDDLFDLCMDMKDDPSIEINNHPTKKQMDEFFKKPLTPISDLKIDLRKKEYLWRKNNE